MSNERTMNTAPPSALESRAARGQLFVVSAPSGCGKTTLVRMLLGAEPATALSVSTTTRPARGTETHGNEYYFVETSRFREMVAAGEFVEWAEVHGHLYGTSAREIDRLCDDGQHVLFDIDYQGARALKSCYPDATAILILPPTMESLRQRLERRGTDKPEVIERRWGAAWKELEHYGIFDFIIVNDHLEQAFSELHAIYRAQQNRWWRHAHRVENLLKEKKKP